MPSSVSTSIAGAKWKDEHRLQATYCIGMYHSADVLLVLLLALLRACTVSNVA